MHFFSVLLVSLLPALSTATASSSPIFFNIESFMHKRSFKYFVSYTGDISKQSRFGKGQDVFALQEGHLMETHLVDGKMVPNPYRFVSFQIDDAMFEKDTKPLLQAFKMTDTTLQSSDHGRFEIDDQGFLQWIVFEGLGEEDSPTGGMKAVWCSDDDKLMVTGNGNSDKRCLGWGLKARIVDTVIAGSDAEL